MPIFNKDLPTFDKSLEGFPEHDELYKGKLLPDTLHPSVPNLNDEFGEGTNNMDVQDVFRMNSVQSGPIFGSTLTELQKNKRYDFYKPGVNYEDIYARTQPWYNQIGNGLVKMGAFALGTFAQSFNSIPETAAALAKGDLSELSGNDGYVAPIDDWMKNFEDSFPNYYSDYERAHPFKSILGSGFANFLGDKFAKNLGFMGGAIAGALVQDAAIGFVTEGLGEIPLMANQIGKASLYLNKLFSTETKIGRALGATEKGILTSFLESGARAGRTTEQLAKMENLAQLAASKKLNNQFRYGLNLWSSALTESGVESRDGYRTLKQDLIDQYKLENFGQAPTEKDLQDIEDIATASMNARMVGNLGILLVSNAIQFENILKPFSSARTGITSPIYQEIAGKRVALQDGLMGGYSEVVPKSILGRAGARIKPYVPELLTEGVYEEGGQYALERGTYAYYNKKYLDQKNNKSRNDVSEFISALGQGLTDQFTTTAGLENMFIGALTAGVIGKGRSIVDNARGVGSKAQIAAEINNLNSHQLTGVFQNNFENAAQQLQASKDMEAAVKNKDVFSYKNAQYKALFSYVNSRLQGNRFGLLEEEIKLAKDLPEDQFKQMFGFDANADNRRVANEYLSLVQDEANKIKENHDKINEFFVNPYKYIRTPKTDEEIREQNNYRQYEDYKTAMTYFPSLLDHMEKREASIQGDLSKISPLLSTDLVKKLGSVDNLLKLADEYEKDAKASLDLISEYTTPEDRKAIERKAKDLRKLAENIYNVTSKASIPTEDVTSDYKKLFDNLVNFELNGRDASIKNTYIKHPLDVDKAISFATDLNKIDDAKKDANDAFNILSDPEKGFEEFRKVDETRLPPVHPEGSEINAGREYEIEKLGKYRTKKIADDRYQIIGPDNTIVSTHTNKLEASATTRYLNKNLNSLKKVKAIRDNGDGTVRVVDMNGDIQDIPKVQILKYTPLETQLEKLAKDKEVLKKEQDEIEKTNGGVSTGNPDTESKGEEPEGKLRSANKHFISGTSESEKYADPSKTAPHITRSRQFLNDVKNFPNRNNMRAILVTPGQMEALGLKGLAQMSYGKPIDTPLSEIADIENVQRGLIAQVFVVQEGGKVFFVSKDGTKLTEVGGKDADGNVINVDLNQVIFQAMPVTQDEKGEVKLLDSKGRKIYRENQKDEFLAYNQAWAKYREQLFKMPAGKYPIFEFTVSRGVPKRNEVDGKSEQNHVGGILVPANKVAGTQGLIVIPTTGTIAHNGELIKFSNGRPVLQYGDTLEFLNNKQFSNKQVDTLFEVVKALSEGYVSKRVLERKYTKFLKNVMFYSKKEGANNRFYINPETSDVIIGSKKFSITEIAEKEKEIKEELKKIYHNVNNEGLTTDFNSKFVEFYLDKEGKLAEREWKNYQDYLLSGSYPDGKARPIAETPLNTNVAAPTEAIPYSFEQKYATLEGLNLDVQFTPKATTPTPTAQPTTTGIDFSGTKENTLKVNDELGEVKFTATLDENNKPVIKASSTIKIGDVAKNPAIVKKYTDVLRQIGRLDESKTPEEQLMDFVALNLTAQVVKIQEAQTAAPAVQPTVPEEVYEAFTEEREKSKEQDIEEEQRQIEAKKADIERRRQKSLNNTVVKGSSGQYKKARTIPQGIGLDQFGNLMGNIYRMTTTLVTGQKLDKPVEDSYIITPETLYRKSMAEGSVIDEQKLQIAIKELQDKINAAYDAELAALEGKPVPKEDGATDGPSDNSMDLRAVGEGEEGGMTDEELELFKDWHAKNVPGIPYEILENLIILKNGEKAWGAFENGVAKFVRGGLRGTEYHEVFEGIWNGFLSETEQEAIIRELRESGKDFIDRASGKKMNYATATKTQIKERIADDFSDYRLGKLSGRTLGDKIRRFFKAIMDFFKGFVNKPSLKEQLFKAIDTGKFKDRILSDTVKNKASEYRKVGQMSEKETHDWIQDMQARASRLIYKDAKENIFKIGGVTSNEVFDAIKEQYKNERYKGVIKSDYLENDWNELITRTKQSLRTLGINFNQEDKVDINDVNYNNRDYAPEPFSVDWKRTSTGPLKFTIATLIQTKALNQEGKLTIELPKPEISAVGGYKLANYGRSFATLMDRLSNTSSVTKFVDKLLALGKNDSTYIQLYQKLGGKLSTETMDFDNFSNADWRLFIQAVQTFSKQKPEAYAQYIKENETYIAPANLYTATNEIKRQWMDNIKIIASKPAKGIPSDLKGADRLKWVLENDYKLIRFADKTYKVDRDILKLFPIRDANQMITMLKSIGIEFPIDVYTALNTTDKNKFAKAVSSIVSYFGKEEDVMKITKETIGINGPLSTLAELIVKTTNPNIESTYFNLEGERVNSYSENNLPSVFENEFNDVSTIDELLTLRPELKENFFEDNNGNLKTNSQVLKKGGRFFDDNGNRTDVKVKVSYIQGTDDNGKAISTTRLGLGARGTQQINENLNGNYYILIPADGSTEWMMELGNTIEFQDFDADRATESINEIFRGYLMDDIALARDGKNREKNRNVAPRAFELRFFKDILSEDVLTGLNELILSEETTDAQIEEYVNNNIEDINASIKAYIDSTVAETKAGLIRNGQVLMYDIKEDSPIYTYPDLENNFASKNGLDKNNLSEKDLTNLITFLNTNFIINNIEMHKILIGDPYQFAIKEKDGKTILDETKRIKSLLSPARTTFDHPIFNNHLNDTLNKVGEVSLKEGDPGYHDHKSYMNTVTFKDDMVVGSLANIMPEYGDVNVADAASWIMDTTHREMQSKNGQWTPEAEAFHQWQMAYTRNRLAEKGEWSYEKNPALEKADNQLLKNPAPKHTLAIIKPIVRGFKYGATDMDLVIDKFSQMPMYYSMVEGTSLEKLYLQMMKQGKGYGIVISGRKVGAEQLHSLYNANGSFNEEVFNNNVKIPWKAYSVQVETGFEHEKEQPRGSQLTKLSSLDLFDNGVPVSEVAKKEYERNTRILNQMTLNGYRELLNKLGIIDTGNGFVMPNGKAISEVLVQEMLRRSMSDNAIDTIQTDEDGQFLIPFEASPSYIQIRDIMYSLIDKAIGSPKMSGGSYVQVPVTGFEDITKGRDLVRKIDGKWTKITKAQYEALTEKEKKGVALTDNTLKFYEDKDGKRYCEVMLPAWFKDTRLTRKLENGEKLTEEEQAILTGIGFRIPTQAMSSVEVFKVKGFLPSYMGYTVVVPAEITTKAGSDFDIDKLNMYLKATYIDELGNLRLVKYMGSEEATKEFYANVFDKKLERKKINKAELFEAAKVMMYNLDDPKGLANRYSDLIDDMMSDFKGENNVLDFENYLTKELERLEDKQVQSVLKEKFVKKMYKKSLENEYYDSLEKLITLPENFKRLVSPVNDAGLSKIANRLDELIGYDESNIKNRILNREYMTNLRHAFLLAKKWVGIAAVNITGHSLFQKSKMYIDTSRISELSTEDQKLLRDGSVALDHNTVEIDGETRISMSGTKTADGKQYISDRLSGYATAFVDVAKDPYILKIIKSDLIVGTFMFLERIGAGKQAATFLNQPIITEYLSMLDSGGMRSLFTKSNINYIKSKFVTTADAIDSVKMDVSIENLEKNIQTYAEEGKLSPEKNAEQIAIFDEFLKYAKMAEQNFEFSQAINYDTTKFRGGDAFARKQWRTEKAKQVNIISSIDNIFENSFMGDLEQALRFAMGSMEAVFKLEKADMRMLVEDILRPYGENKYVGNDEFERVAIRAKSALLDYIIETKTNLGSRLKELLVDKETSVANRLLTLKDKYPNLQILKDLTIDTSERPDGAKTVKLTANPKDAYDENLYTGYMRELRDFNDETKAFYYDLVATSLTQGTYQSPVTFRNIVPIEDYSEMITPALSVLVADESMKEFANSFAKNNFKDDDIVPRYSPKFFAASEEPVAVQLTSFGDVYADIFQYYSSIFPNIKHFNIRSSERKLMLLNRKYNDYYMGNTHLKVPRVITDRSTGESIDMLTGRTITKMDYARMKAKGDLSLSDVFGYQRVNLPGGDPLVTYDKDGNEIYVYKLINLLGDGNRAKEHYKDDRASVFQNGTIQISNPIPDADIIEYYGGEIEKKDISSQKTSELRVDIPMSSDNVKKIEAGEKTTTVRTQTEADKIDIPVGEARRRKIGGKVYAVRNRGFLTVQEAGGKSAMLKSEGVKDESELNQEHTKEFVRGERRLYVYDIKPLPETVTTQPSRLSVLEEKMKTKGLSPAEIKELNELRAAKPVEEVTPAQPKVEVKKKELFAAQQGREQKSFRGKTLEFVDKIPTNKETVVAMSNREGKILIDQKAMEQKFEDKAWTNPAKQLDGSFSTPLNENEFGTFDEWLTFALIHEVKHDSIKKAEDETTGQYEDRINKAALEDLRENYDVGIKDEGSIVYDPEEDRVGMTVGSDEKGYVSVKFDGTDETIKFKRSELELSDSFSLKDASRFNNIELETNNIITVDNANLRLLSVEETDYDNVKFLRLQSKSGLIVPAIIEYNEETGESEIIPNPAAWELGLDEDEYNTDDFKC